MGRGTAFPAGVTRGQKGFSQVPSVNAPRSQFDRSCGLKTAFDAGDLIPIFVDEALPGDTMNLRTFSFCRMATPIHPVMDNMFMDFFFFAVPIRLIWNNFQKFMGEQTDPGDSTDYSVPTMTQSPGAGSLSDYLGLPIGNGIVFNSLHHRAYNFIYNEWFRDENLQDSLVVDTDDGPDTSSDYAIVKRGKRHDYFSSCLPWPQKGTAVELPLGSTAPVVSAGDGIPKFELGSTGGYHLESQASGVQTNWSTAHLSVQPAEWDETKLEADLSTATAATINEIREAFQVQKLLERDARGGSRYTEILRSHFGVVSADQRLQRPEYLGGGSTRINVNAVAATAGGTLDDVGELGGFATQTANGIGFVKSFTEHCVILGLVNVRADITYQQGIDRMFLRQSRYDYYWPSLAHLGEQVVTNAEIYADGSANDDLAFGYQERYAEYRYKPSRVTGKMRSDAAGTLDPWHLALDFSSLPLLNDVFIEDAPPISRVVQTPAEPEFIGDFYFAFKHARPMPTFSVPGLIDHF